MFRKFAICVASLLCSCGPRATGTYFNSGIRDYTGDGEIHDTSQRSGAIQSRGYLVELPHFPLNKPYERTFQLDGLPTIDGKETEVAFLVPETFLRTDTANARSTVEFALSTAEGKQITSHKSRLGELTWSTPVHGHSGHALYHLDRSFFQPVATERYRLRVTYLPADGADGSEGYFYLWSGVGGS